MERKKLKVYPHRDKVYQKALIKIRDSDLSDKNKEILDRFQKALLAGDAAEYRTGKVLGQLLRILMEMCPEVGINKDLDAFEKVDLEALMGVFKRKCKTKATEFDYRRAIRQFFRWFEDEDSRFESESKDKRLEAKKLYKKLKEIKTHFTPPKINPNDLITEEEVERVIKEGCVCLRDKAFLSVLHESGARIGELLNMRVEDISFTQNGCKVVLDGKTGLRRVLLAKLSIKYLSQYLETHPFKQDTKAWLWITDAVIRKIKNKGKHKLPLNYPAGRALIARCFKRAGLDAKKHNPHWFRKSRASINAAHLTEGLQNKYMGWIQGSQQARIYQHIHNKDVDDAILKMHGLNDKKEEIKNKPQKCVCGAVNPAQGSWCFNCGNPLSTTSAMMKEETIKQEMDSTIKTMMEMMQNPEFLKAFELFKAQKNKSL